MLWRCGFVPVAMAVVFRGLGAGVTPRDGRCGMPGIVVPGAAAGSACGCPRVRPSVADMDPVCSLRRPPVRSFGPRRRIALHGPAAVVLPSDRRGIMPGLVVLGAFASFRLASRTAGVGLLVGVAVLSEWLTIGGPLLSCAAALGVSAGLAAGVRDQGWITGCSVSGGGIDFESG